MNSEGHVRFFEWFINLFKKPVHRQRRRPNTSTRPVSTARPVTRVPTSSPEAADTSVPVVAKASDFFSAESGKPVDLSAGVDVKAFDIPTVSTLDFHLRDAARTAKTESEKMMMMHLRRAIKNEGIPLPTSPDSVMRIQRMVSSQTCNVEQLQLALSREPVLATKLIGIANSPFFVTKVPCRAVKDAVMRIGLTETRNIVMALACRSKLFRIPGNRKLADNLYRNSVVTAHAVRQVSHAVGVDEDHAFLAGLIHDLGRIVIHTAAADVHRMSKGRLQPTLSSIHKLAAEIAPTLSALIAETWNLDPAVVTAVEWQNFPAGAPPATIQLTASLHDGKILAGQLTNNEVADDETLLIELDEISVIEFEKALSEFDDIIRASVVAA
ncbi:MAG: HDOD domain-containing protein [Myxococcota bacterium]|nr:HDOD domain-containing protein [Myxococcota bacterium]